MASKVIVYGGKGALGQVLVSHFKARGDWVCSIDLGANEAADASVVINPAGDLNEQAAFVLKEVAAAAEGAKFDALFCVAGGWAGGNAAADAFVKNCDLMMKQSIWTSIISANVAAHHLKEGGLLTLTGAVPCLNGTSGMIGYGLAKAAVHQLTKSLAQDKGGLPAGAAVLTILPVTLDTPMNRKFMASADFSTWTPMSYVGEMFESWLTDPSSRHPNGSLVKLITKDNVTVQELA